MSKLEDTFRAPPAQAGKRLNKTNALAYAKLMKALIPGTLTFEELTEECGLHYHTVRAICNALHDEGAAHIAMWEKDARGRDALRIYKLGEGKDAKRQRKTAAERQALCRAKNNSIKTLYAMAGAQL